MKYKHPNIIIEEPAPGHYSVSGLPPQNVFIEGEGTICAPGHFYISPAVPSDLLIAIVEERGDMPATKGRPGRQKKALEIDAEVLAGQLYEAHHESLVTGFDGEAPPSWEDFSTDTEKKALRDAWVAVAHAAIKAGRAE